MYTLEHIHRVEMKNLGLIYFYNEHNFHLNNLNYVKGP